MATPEEMIQGGKLPDGTPGLEVTIPAPVVRVEEPEVAEEIVTDLSRDSSGQPVFADLDQQVVYDWNHLSSDQLKLKKNSSSAYKEALLRLLNAAPAPASETPEAVVEVAPVITPAEPVVVAPVDEEEVSSDTRIKKVKGGWEATVDLKDGSGKQVYKAKTKDELIVKLLDAQTHATKKIQNQEQERRLLIASEPADVDEPSVRFKPRVLTADEQWQIANDLGDPAKAVKALDKYIETRLGGSIDQVIEKITSHDEDLEYRRARNEAMAFIRETPEFYNTPDNSAKLATYVEEKGWASTKRNLNKAFVILSNENELEQRPLEQVLTPEAEPVSTEPVRETVELPVSKADGSPVPAAPVAKPGSSEPAKPTGLSEGTRMRPGSNSTGMSPRQSSVRTGGAAPAVPVGLTAEEYHRIPTATIKHKYKSDAAFKAQVDKLMAEGKI